ncbi:DUF3299 domain-containing protein [Pseudomonas sp. TTU2014-080ASC]|jgi:hypothetical protein|uniref:DUF3299 domain-containing protein n=1 Tax=Pseudomonas sp. TTU2014-080ASC TaxID=1729724 RepID=UPI0007183277|nr:DUF3299 domain-containing protein [Pseudomonas sp. TTU2014-080ASC]KRW61154.1 hypothetical protein AO726_07415 [Pseudomonas sp. TTU2014-080ASC]
MRYLLLSLLLSCSLAQAEIPETDWLDLMPEADRKALENMPDITHNGAELESSFYSPSGLRQKDSNLPEVMYSTRTVPAFDGKEVRLGGYPVPLETDSKGNSTLFFLVPYPGACIHVPPPPPNQLVLVRYPQGIALEDIYAPLWVSGTMKVEQISNELADAAYALDAKAVKAVEEGEW